jgi:hypothetical protein
MAWSAPTSDLVLSEFTPQEAAAIQRIQGANSLPAIFARVVNEIRDYIRAGGYNLDPDETKIPDGLHNDSIDLTRWRLLISLPALRSLQTEERKNACERAEKKLDRIAAQKFAVEEPTLPDDPPPVTPAGTWGGPNKLIMRTQPAPRPGVQFPRDANEYSNPAAPQDYGDGCQRRQ